MTFPASPSVQPDLEQIEERINTLRQSLTCVEDPKRNPAIPHVRITGYIRPISWWNKGKKSEHSERKYFKPS